MAGVTASASAGSSSRFGGASKGIAVNAVDVTWVITCSSKLLILGPASGGLVDIKVA